MGVTLIFLCWYIWSGQAVVYDLYAAPLNSYCGLQKKILFTPLYIQESAMHLWNSSYAHSFEAMLLMGNCLYITDSDIHL